jgi:hypothetical protein
MQDFIFSYFISKNLCDEITEYFDNAAEKKLGTIAIPGEDGILKKSKNSQEMRLDPQHLLYKKYINELQNCLNQYIQKFPFCNYYGAFSILENIKIQKYPTGGGYLDFHTERGSRELPNSSRHLVFMTYLNSITNGGGTEFFHQKLVVEAEKGKTIIWPADWTHTHRGIAAEKDEKIIVTGWYSFVV